MLTSILLSVLAGLVLFLYAVFQLSQTLETALGPRAEEIIGRFSSNAFRGILTGIVATTLLDSSSAVIVLTIVLVNAKALTFRAAMGIVLGANIGTTVGSQIIALDVGAYAPLLMLPGFGLYFLARNPRIRISGKVLFYFGTLFFGLHTLGNAVEPLRDEAAFLAWMEHTETPWLGAMIGALLTILIQSSSATVGMAIVLGKKGLLSLAGGIAIMLGAELGTCADTLLATIKGSRQALKTGLFHLMFNLITLILGLLWIQPFTALVQTLSAGAPLERSLANAHLLFNLLGVLLLVWTLPWFERVLNRLLPDRGIGESQPIESLSIQ